MATVNIVQPKIGSITVLSRTESTITVRWNEPAIGDSKFGGFKLYCEACGGTLIHIETNPATFNLAELQNEGHPGPFDISAVAEGSGDVYVYTNVAEGTGTTRVYPADQSTHWQDYTDSLALEVPVGRSTSFTLRATPGVGWDFVKWEINDATVSTDFAPTYTIRKSSTAETVLDYYAYFTRQNHTLYTRTYTDGSYSSTKPIGGTVNGSTGRSQTIGRFDYEDQITLVAVPLAGYRFVKWEVILGTTEGEGVHLGDTFTGLTWSFRMPAANTRIAAYFESVSGSLLYGRGDTLIYGSSGTLLHGK